MCNHIKSNGYAGHEGCGTFRRLIICKHENRTYLGGKEIITHVSLNFHLCVIIETCFASISQKENIMTFTVNIHNVYNVNDNLFMKTSRGIEKGFGVIEFLP